MGLAWKSGVAPTTIYNVEAGRHGTSLSVALKLARALDVSLDDLVGHEVETEAAIQAEDLRADHAA